MHRGSCLCGAIKFEVSGDLSSSTACHCTQCRKHSGHYDVSTDISSSKLTVSGTENLTWFRDVGKNVRRGFCSICGSSLFWEVIGEDWTAVSMGAFDTPTNTKLAQHIFVAFKGDYYEIMDKLPQSQQ